MYRMVLQLVHLIKANSWNSRMVNKLIAVTFGDKTQMFYHSPHDKQLSITDQRSLLKNSKIVAYTLFNLKQLSLFPVQISSLRK